MLVYLLTLPSTLPKSYLLVQISPYSHYHTHFAVAEGDTGSIFQWVQNTYRVGSDTRANQL